MSTRRRVKSLVDNAARIAEKFDNPDFLNFYTYALEQAVENNNTAFFEFISQLKQPPVGIEHFLDSDDFMKHTDLKLWPVVRETIVALNTNWWRGKNDGAMVELLCMGATGTGKSEIAKVTTAYQLHILGCMNKPQTYWSLPTATQILIPIFAAKPKVTKQVLYMPLRAYCEQMPWFQKHMRMDPYIESEMYFPEQNIRVHPVGADADSILGEAIPGGIVDEINFMQVVENSRKAEAKTGRASRYDQAEDIYNKLTRRKDSRFTRPGPNVGIICALSSTSHPGEFTEKRRTEIRRDGITNVLIYDKAQYEVQPQEQYSGEKFHVCIHGDTGSTIELLDSGEPLPKDADIYDVPIELKPNFQRDPEGSTRDIIGKSVRALNPFITRRTAIEEAFSLWHQLNPPLIVETPNVLTYFGLPDMNPDDYCRNPMQPRYVHIDLAHTSDRCGIAMVRYDGTARMERRGGIVEHLPTCVVELAMSIEPDTQEGIDIAEVRSWVGRLKTELGYPIRVVSYDGWNCISDKTNIWTDRGLIRAGEVAVGDVVQTRSGPRPVEKVWNYGQVPTVVVTTQHGHFLEMTRKHKIEVLEFWRMENGKRVPKWKWATAGSLKQNDVVRIWDQETQVQPSDLVRLAHVPCATHNKIFSQPGLLTESVARAIGLLHGDGSFGDGYFTLTCHTEEKTEAEAILQKAFYFENKISWRQKDNSQGWTLQIYNRHFTDWVRRNGLGEKYVVPEKIKQSPINVQAAFISGLLAADGSVKARDGQISVETVSRDYAEYLMSIVPMAFGMGVNMTTREERVCTLPQGGTSVVNSFIVSFRGSRADFLKKIGVGYQSKQAQVEAHKHVAGRSIFSKVASIVSSQANVVDFQVQGDHSYLANGFVSHNSLESRQQWKKQGMKTVLTSVDKTTAPYKELRDAIYDGRIAIYPNEVLMHELYDLEMDTKKDKVDHPPSGTKDVADALCGAYYVMLHRASTWRGDDGTGRDQIVSNRYVGERVSLGERF